LEPKLRERAKKDQVFGSKNEEDQVFGAKIEREGGSLGHDPSIIK